MPACGSYNSGYSIGSTVAGQEYFFVVEGYGSGNNGQIEVNIACGDAPEYIASNDLQARYTDIATATSAFNSGWTWSSWADFSWFPTLGGNFVSTAPLAFYSDIGGADDTLGAWGLVNYVGSVGQ